MTGFVSVIFRELPVLILMMHQDGVAHMIEGILEIESAHEDKANAFQKSPTLQWKAPRS